jgi:hypothetical protein
VTTVLLWVTRLAAIATVPPAVLVLVYLGGSDDVARTPLAPIVGLGIVGTAIWGAIASIGQLATDPGRTAAILAVPPVLYLLSWPVAGNRAMGRPPVREHLAGLVLLVWPCIAAACYAWASTSRPA